MIFGTLPLEECQGAILAHAVRAGDQLFRKGRYLTAADLAALAAHGHSHIVVARLEPGDIGEDQAAADLARAVAGAHIRTDPPFTGRANLFAETSGLLCLDEELIDAINEIDEAMTLATLANRQPVMAGQMVATVKIIPFAVPASLLQKACAVARRGTASVRVAPFRSRRIGLIQTVLPTLKESVLDKTRDITARRVMELGSTLVGEKRCAHQMDALRSAIDESLKDQADLLLILGASAITDRLDVIPAAVTALGGHIEQFGMPVDPGNLLLLAGLGDIPVIGLPGCARSPKRNGVDWVLQRLAADLPVTARDIRRMGVGGLLGEIPSRPQPRLGDAPSSRPDNGRHIAAIILAAGQSRRMGQNKLLLDLHGKPLLCHVIDQALALDLSDIVVVAGHQASEIRSAIGNRPVRIVLAPDYAEGMSASLKTGIDSLKQETDAAMILLGDMPQVAAPLLRRMISAYNPVEGRAIVLPVHEGKRGNPVLWDRRFFPEMRQLAGDVGARHLIGEHAELVAEIAVDDRTILRDIDTPEAYAKLHQDFTA
ncbi:molybdopterin-binding/glycosyltransferase family 2 protein [Dongia soli]|uniref:Molybdopterin-binding/glycosyltransferase family 2 protein n=1 Tax=Dongia soli TaxID=600628 RepID=A0ABU5E8Y0_9PROT|nr:molybdopterin-binding/glycosyltransferase family 2 protein [Dongia soli]MDY0882499.1 molybdopterin-binding/glycosyltransferase family 2 protein [Dongia soli]